MLNFELSLGQVPLLCHEGAFHSWQPLSEDRFDVAITIKGSLLLSYKASKNSAFWHHNFPHLFLLNKLLSLLKTSVTFTNEGFLFWHTYRNFLKLNVEEFYNPNVVETTRKFLHAFQVFLLATWVGWQVVDGNKLRLRSFNCFHRHGRSRYPTTRARLPADMLIKSIN